MPSYRRPLFAVVLSLCAALGVADVGLAADVAIPVKPSLVPAQSNAWSYTVTPYFWMLSLNGSSTIKGVKTDVDATFIDLLHREIPKQLFGLMASAEARNDRFSIFGDFVYMKLGASADASRSVTRGPINASLAASANLNVEMVVAELAATYEIMRWGSSTNNTALDVVGGGRLWWQRAEVDLTLTGRLTLPGFTVDGSRAFADGGDVTWVDPLIGMRLRHQVVPGHELTLSGDVGGFGIGSDFSWQAIGAYNFEVARTTSATWSGLIGYRALHVDFSKGSGTTRYGYDMLQHGPIVGLTLQF
jgi:hypothetical protein